MYSSRSLWAASPQTDEAIMFYVQITFTYGELKDVLKEELWPSARILLGAQLGQLMYNVEYNNPKHKVFSSRHRKRGSNIFVHKIGPDFQKTLENHKLQKVFVICCCSILVLIRVKS